MLSFGLLLRSIQIHDTAAIFIARTWHGRYTLPLAVFLASKSSTKF
jgi:hypothetical protein